MNKKLDYLLVPTGWKRQRKKRALEEIKRREIRNILILNGCNSEEDILDLGKKLKGGEKIGIVTFPLHFKEYELIIKKAQKLKKFPKKIKLENIETKETFRQFLYGVFGLVDEELIEGKVDYKKNKHEIWILSKSRKFLKNILG
jgi:hypothetical protein